MREFVRMGAEAEREGGEGREVTRVEDAVAEKFGHGVCGGERGGGGGGWKGLSRSWTADLCTSDSPVA